MPSPCRHIRNHSTTQHNIKKRPIHPKPPHLYFAYNRITTICGFRILSVSKSRVVRRSTSELIYSGIRLIGGWWLYTVWLYTLVKDFNENNLVFLCLWLTVDKKYCAYFSSVHFGGCVALYCSSKSLAYGVCRKRDTDVSLSDKRSGHCDLLKMKLFAISTAVVLVCCCCSLGNAVFQELPTIITLIAGQIPPVLIGKSRSFCDAQYQICPHILEILLSRLPFDNEINS